MLHLNFQVQYRPEAEHLHSSIHEAKEQLTSPFWGTIWYLGLSLGDRASETTSKSPQVGHRVTF